MQWKSTVLFKIINKIFKIIIDIFFQWYDRIYID